MPAQRSTPGWGADPEALAGAASRLHRPADDLRSLASEAAWMAPDAGPAPAPAAVADVQAATVEALRALADELCDSARRLDAAAQAYRCAERDAATVVLPSAARLRPVR